MKVVQASFIVLLLFFGLTGIATAGPSFETAWQKTMTDSVEDVTVSADGSTVAVLTDSSLICYTTDGTVLWEVPADHARHVGISEDGTLIVADGEDLRAYDGTGTRVFRHSNGYFAFGVGVSPDGSCLAGGFDNNSLVLFRKNATGTFLPSWSVETDDDVVALDLADNASSVVSGEKNGMITRYGDDGRVLWRYDTGSRELSCSVAADGAYIAVGADHGTIFCINRNGNLLWTASSGDRLPGVRIARDKDLIVAGGEEIVLRSTDGEDLGTVSDTPAHALGVSGDGKKIAAAEGKTVTFSRAVEEMLTAGTGTLSETPTPATPDKTDAPETNATQSPLPVWAVVLSISAALYCVRRQ